MNSVYFIVVLLFGWGDRVLLNAPYTGESVRVVGVY